MQENVALLLVSVEEGGCRATVSWGEDKFEIDNMLTLTKSSRGWKRSRRWVNFTCEGHFS